MDFIIFVFWFVVIQLDVSDFTQDCCKRFIWWSRTRWDIPYNLKWDVQVDSVVKKANSRLFMLRTLKRFGFTSEELSVVYSGYVRPILEYADVVWHSSITASQTHEIEATQKRACRIILGRNYTSYEKALEKCKLNTLSGRREEHCLRFAEGLSKSTRTSSLVPPTRGECHSRLLRNNRMVTQLPARTNRFQNSPVPFYVNLLNKQVLG